MTALPPPRAFRMSAADVAWLRMEEPTNPMTITGVLRFNGHMPRGVMAQVLRERILPFNRFRMSIDDPDGSSPRWVPEPGFSLDRHLLEAAVPKPGGHDGLEVLVSRLMSTPLPLTHSPWQMHLVHGVEGDHSALVVRLHHCIADGIALMHVLFSAADEYDAPLKLPESKKTPPPLWRRVARTAIGAVAETTDLLTHPRRLAGRTAKTGRVLGALGGLLTMPPDSPTVLKSATTPQKRAAWTPPISLDTVKEVARSTDAKVNDVLLAVAAGALRRHLESRKQPTDNVEVRAAVPFNVRPLNRSHELGNAFALVFLLLPVSEPNLHRRLALLKKRMDAVKASEEPAAVYGILQSIGMAPHWAHQFVVNLFSQKASAVMTNVPGPPQRLHFRGVPLHEIMFWVPQAGDIGLGLSILSYAGMVRVGIAADAAIGDPAAIARAFEMEFADLTARYITS